MRSRIQQELATAATRALSLAGLPAGATLSIRKLSIGATALTVQPVIGAPGQALSEYQPQPADLMPV